MKKITLIAIVLFGINNLFAQAVPQLNFGLGFNSGGDLPIYVSYDFPVGDTSGIIDYSPVKLTFNSATFTDAIVSINLKNEKHAENSSANGYIDRYWTISQTGITDFSWIQDRFYYAVPAIPYCFICFERLTERESVSDQLFEIECPVFNPGYQCIPADPVGKRAI